jgi:CheY-like chemotaxis protein
MPRILLVDDVLELTELLSHFLRVGGYETRIATNGLEAIRIAEEFLPDFVLLDIGMPNLNGFDTAKRIRSKAWSKGMLFIGMSGYSDSKYTRRAREAGFKEYLLKPTPLKTVMDVIEKVTQESEKTLFNHPNGGNLGRLRRVGCFGSPKSLFHQRSI